MLPAAAPASFAWGAGGFLRQREDIHAQGALKKFLDFPKLGFVTIGGRHSGVGRRKPMRVHEAVDVAGIVRRDQRHVAIRALLRLGRIIK